MYMQKASLLATAILFVSQAVFAQISISGQTCVTAGNTYTYSIAGGCNSSHNIYWCANGGTIVGYGSCRGAVGLCSVTVQWSSGTSLSIDVHNYNDNGSGNLAINVMTPLV